MRHKPTQSRSLNFAIMFALLVQSLEPLGIAQEVSEDSSKCPGFFARVLESMLPAEATPNLALQKQLSKKLIFDYFPETELVLRDPRDPLQGKMFTEDSLEQFRRDFDTLLNQRAALSEFPAEQYRTWLKTVNNGKPYPPLTPELVQQILGPENATLLDLQDSYNNIRVSAKFKSKYSTVVRNLRAKQVAKGVAKKTAGLSLAILAFMAGTLKGSIIAGPIAGIMNSFVSAPLKPVQESMEQISNSLFSGLARSIQGYMKGTVTDLQNYLAERPDAEKNIANLKKNLKEAKEAVRTLDKMDFEGMDRNKVKEIMDGFEERYFKIFQTMSALMPPYMRAGRDLLFDWGAMKPLLISQATSTFETEYMNAEYFKNGLNESIKARGKPASPDELLMLNSYQHTMDVAEDRLAFSLATWRLFSIMYAEIDRGPDNQDFSAAFSRYKKFMNMDKYKKELSTKIKEVFKNFDPTFNQLENLEQEKQP